VITPEQPAAGKKKDKKDKKDKKGEQPANPIVVLRNILTSVFPAASAENKNQFDPHLSIGQFDQQKVSNPGKRNIYLKTGENTKFD
jgi:hypothetical protein